MLIEFERLFKVVRVCEIRSALNPKYAMGEPNAAIYGFVKLPAEVNLFAGLMPVGNRVFESNVRYIYGFKSMFLS